MSLWRSLKARDRGALTEGAAVDSRTFASDWPEAVSSDSRQLQIGIPRQVLKGGSHLCAPSHCRRYRPAVRRVQPIDRSASHIGSSSARGVEMSCRRLAAAVRSLLTNYI